MQKRFESDPLFQATTAVAPGAGSQGDGVLLRTPPSSPTYAQTSSGHGDAGARFQQPRHADAGSAVAVERQIPRDDHERGRRLQPLEGPRRHALARRQHLRQLGHVLLHPRRGERGVLVNRLSADAQAIEAVTKRFSRKGGRSSAAATTTSTPIPRSLFRPRMTSSCAGSASPTVPGRAERSMSRVTRKSFSHRRPRTRCIRRSAISLFRPRSSASSGRSSARAGPAPQDEQAPWMFHLMAVHGAEIGEVSYETDRMQFIGRGNTVADPQAMSGLSGALGQRGLRARSDCRHPVPDHARSGRIGNDQYCLRHRRNPRCLP